ncbi:uncharacterized protein [Halyomorpha halys]|uniref:uncharacterized protein isoform X1 n=1 Tax=Halyomorpha halys TaxID=286706 RepID=UPI0006D52421|nr:uncharacterized protein LOC106690269 isoform X1 [Halyomorpha halys]
MDQCGTSQGIPSKVVIKDELDIDCEDYNNGCGGSGEIKIKQEPFSSISGADDNEEKKQDDDFPIVEYGKRCCVWLKEDPAPLLAQDPCLPLLSLPEGTEIIKVKPINYTKPMRFQNDNEDINMSSSSKYSTRNEKKSTKDEFDAISTIWTSKLLKLEETQRVLAEDLINQILKKGFFKDLTPNTVLYDGKYQGLTPAEKQKKYRERLKADPVRREEFLRKERERVLKRRMKVADMSSAEHDGTKELGLRLTHRLRSRRGIERD